MDLTEADVAYLSPLAEPDRALHLLTGRVGPLADFGGFPTHVAAVAYLISQVRRRARNPSRKGMLAGRPGWEADETLRNRVLTAAECSGSLQEFAVVLCDRLNLQLPELRAADLLWWHGASRQHADRWHELTDPLTLAEVLTAAKLLDDLTYTLRQEMADDDAQ